MFKSALKSGLTDSGVGTVGTFISAPPSTTCVV